MKWIFSAIFLLNAIFIGVNGQCEKEDFEKCQNMLKDLQNNEFMYEGYDDKKIDDMCKPLKEGITCLQDIVNRCRPGEMDPAVQIMNGLGQLVGEMCTKGSQTRKDMLAMGNCMNDAKGDVETCKTKMESKSQIARRTGSVVEACCSVYGMLTCTENAAEKFCGEKGKNFLRRTMSLVMGPILKPCESHRDTCGVSCLVPGVLSIVVAIFSVLKSYF